MHIVRARSRLYRSRREFAAAAGLGKRTIDKLETGEPCVYRPRTIDKVEGALMWAPGSVERVLDGGDPEPAADGYLRHILDAWPNLSEDARRILADLARRSQLP